MYYREDIISTISQHSCGSEMSNLANWVTGG